MKYWYPNRPLLQTRDFLARMDAGEIPGSWWAEPKLNGDRLVLLRVAGKWEFWNRQGARLKYRAPEAMLAELSRLVPAVLGDVQLDGELMHNHTKNVKNLVVLYDVYVVGGEPVRLPLFERLEWLNNFSGGRLPLWFHGVQASVVQAPACVVDFVRQFSKLTALEEIEGLVFKRGDGLIDFNPVKSPDVPWQIKVRRESKNYKF